MRTTSTTSTTSPYLRPPAPSPEIDRQDIMAVDEQLKTAMAMTTATRRTSPTKRLPTPSRNDTTVMKTNTIRRGAACIL